MKKKTILIIAAVVVVIAGALLINHQVQANKQANSQYQTVALEKGDLTAVVGATGTVRSNQSAVLAWKTSGQISSILVDVNDKVSAGQSLAALVESSLPQSVILAQADLVTAQQNLENLKNSTLAQAQAALTLATAQRNYDRVSGNQLYANTARNSNQDQIDQAKSAVVLAQKQVDDAQEWYNHFSETPDSDPTKAAALNSLANARLTLDKAQKNLNYFLNTPNDLELSESSAEVAVAKAQLDDAKREYDRLKDGPDPDDIAAAEARVTALQATLDMASLQAPFAGTITESYSLPGDMVTAGTAGLRIDDLTHLLVDVQLSEVDVNRVKSGQSVNLTFDANPDKVYEGKVKEVSRVGNTASGTVNFNATIEILKPDETVLPGMTAAANIIVDQVKDVLLVPNRAVRLQEGQYIVYVLRNNVPTPVEIEIGSSSDTYSEIKSGDVKPGEKIVLNPPSTFLTTSFMGQ